MMEAMEGSTDETRPRPGIVGGFSSAELQATARSIIVHKLVRYIPRDGRGATHPCQNLK